MPDGSRRLRTSTPGTGYHWTERTPHARSRPSVCGRSTAPVVTLQLRRPPLMTVRPCTSIGGCPPSGATTEIDLARRRLIGCTTSDWMPGAAGPPLRGGLVVLGDHLGRVGRRSRFSALTRTAVVDHRAQRAQEGLPGLTIRQRAVGAPQFRAAR
jgi:hypothetical protein